MSIASLIRHRLGQPPPGGTETTLSIDDPPETGGACDATTEPSPHQPFPKGPGQ